MEKSKKRFIWMFILGAVISYLLDFLLLDFEVSPGRNRFVDLFMSVIITILIWEGNLWLDHLLNLKLKWQKVPKKRFVVQFSLALIYSFSIIYLSMFTFNTFVCKIPYAKQSMFLITSITIGLLITIIILSIEIGYQFFKQWKKSLIEIETYKTESISAQLQNLKSQLNPHFLFNNLSVLSSLVYINQDKAVEFINQLSKVYRYILDNNNNELISLKEEMKFMESYFFLLKIRFGENIIFDIQLVEDSLAFKIPPLSLQILVENAIKHNEISTNSPLKISLSINDNMLQICNNIQLRPIYEPSSKTGIKNIESRYGFFTDKKIEINQDKELFCVKLPLLTVK
jgi:sensor histidine kinase YesM